MWSMGTSVLDEMFLEQFDRINVLSPQQIRYIGLDVVHGWQDIMQAETPRPTWHGLTGRLMIWDYIYS